jgi:hypothetical protein
VHAGIVGGGERIEIRTLVEIGDDTDVNVLLPAVGGDQVDDSGLKVFRGEGDRHA